MVGNRVQSGQYLVGLWLKTKPKVDKIRELGRKTSYERAVKQVEVVSKRPEIGTL